MKAAGAARSVRLGLLAVVGLGACRTLPPGPVPCELCSLTDDNSYRYAPSLSADQVAVAPLEDLRVSWAGLQTDLLGHPLDPLSLDHATLLVFSTFGPDQVLDGLAHDDLIQSDLRIALTCTPTDAGCALSDFGLAGNKLGVQSYLEPGSGTWLVAPGRLGQAGAASMIFLDPVAGTPVQDSVSIAEGSARLEVEVDLHSLTPVFVAVGARPVLDWSELTTDALGNPIELSRFDHLVLEHLDLPLAEIEDRFLDLELLPGTSWEAEVGGQTSLDLAGLDAFPGFFSEGTWLLAVQCSTCSNPAPRFLTVLHVVPGLPTR